MNYTTIQHNVRKLFGLSCNEYCVIDLVFFKMNDPRSKLAGWCTLSRTHITTNLSTDEIEDRYGKRAFDRFRQMFNVIDFPTNAASRRI